MPSRPSRLTPAAKAARRTYSDHDALGRPETKTTDWSDHCAQDPEAPCELVVAYAFTGMTTTVTLPPNIHGANPTVPLVVSYTRNVLGQMVQSVDATGGITAYAYDAAGKPVRVTGVEGTITGQYDNLGRPEWIDDPDRGQWEYTHNGLGELIEQRDAVGNLVEVSYDSLGRMMERHVTRPQDGSSALESKWIYDSPVPGQLNAEAGYDLYTTGTVYRSFAYDGLHRITKTRTCIDDGGTCTGSVVLDVDVVYDSYYGWAKGTRFPGGEIVAYDRNAYGYATAERNPLAPVTDDVYRTTLGMNAQGQVTHERLSNGLDAQMGYFASTGQMQSVCVTSGTCGSPLYRADYRYTDNYLNLTERTANLDPLDDITQRYKRESFRYDNLHRLTETARTWGAAAFTADPITYSYSPSGNLLSKSDYAAEYGYGTQPRSADNAGPHAVSWVRKPGEVDPVSFTYDLNGNLTQADGKLLQYGFLNKPRRIENHTGEVTELFYDPGGARYKQVFTASGVTRTTYYAAKLHERVVEDGVRTDKDYVGDYLIIIDDEDDPAGRQLRYLHRDRLGSIEMMTDQNGQPVGGESRSFDAFGKPRAGTWQDSGGDLNPVATSRGFTAHEHLNDHQLIHMNGRAYDYNLGRFLSVDPVIQFPDNGQSLNPYSYLMNNPFSGTDPSGYTEQGEGYRRTRGIAQDWRITFQSSSGGEKGYLVTAKYKSGAVKQFILTQDAFEYLASQSAENGATSASDIGSPGNTGKRSAPEGGLDSVPGSKVAGRFDMPTGRMVDRALSATTDLPELTRADDLALGSTEATGAGIGVGSFMALAGGAYGFGFAKAFAIQNAGLLTSAGTALTGAGVAAQRFFYDPRAFQLVSRAYWAARGGAGGSSLHHWGIPQKLTWLPQGIRNAGWNLVELRAFRGVFHRSLGLNQWMGFAQNWGPTARMKAMAMEWAIRLGIPAGGSALGYGTYELTTTLSGSDR